MKKSPSEQIRQADPDVVEEWKWGGPVWLFREAVAVNSSGKSKK